MKRTGLGQVASWLVGRDQQQPFGAGLGQQQAIKRITVQRRRCTNRQGVIGLNGQLLPDRLGAGAVSPSP